MNMTYHGNHTDPKTRRPTDEQGQGALDQAISQIEKQFGKGSIMRLGKDGVARTCRLSPPARLPLT